MKRAPLLASAGLFYVAVLLVLASSLKAQEWQQIGYGTLDENTRFDVYVDTRTILHVGDRVRFWQGHVFHSEQPLPEGASYMRVSIEREGDCAERSDRNVRAIFYAKDGSVAQNYSEDGVMKPTGKDTIRARVLEFVCSYKNQIRR